jgi:hypothetical protein
MVVNDLSENSRRFLETLIDHTGGDTTAQRSMFDIGAAVGLDRDESAAIAQDLMGRGLVDIRTLSGGIAISQSTADLVADESPQAIPTGLGNGNVLDGPAAEAVERVLADLKAAVGALGVPYEKMADIVADIRTAEAQLTSSAPKIAVIRECLTALKRLSGSLPDGKWKTVLDAMVDG